MPVTVSEAEPGVLTPNSYKTIIMTHCVLPWCGGLEHLVSHTPASQIAFLTLLPQGFTLSDI